MINTPRVFRREQRSPVRAVRRRLGRTLSGPFVLHPWTTIKLEVRPPQTNPGRADETRR